MEIEIKLAPVLRHQAEALFKDETFFKDAVKTVKMNSVYFDTREQDLRKNGFTFRLRQEGTRTVFCVKGPRSGNARLELEAEAETQADALSAICKDPAMPPAVGGILLSKELSPVFSASFTRRTRNAEYEGACVEASFDEGQLENDGRYAAISELELELKSGDERGLEALASYICEKYGFKKATGTKARRAASLTEEAFSNMQQINPFFVASELLNYCINNGWVQYTIGDDSQLNYFLTDEGKKELPARFGINFDKPCAQVKK